MINQYLIELENAKKALRAGDIRAAKSLAKEAASLDLNQEEPWLLLAALAPPKESIEFLNKALEVNPSSTLAREGMSWAISRYRNLPRLLPKQEPIVSANIPEKAFTNYRPALLPWFLIIFVVSIAFVFGLTKPRISFAFSSNKAVEISQDGLQKSTRTPTPTSTPTPTPTTTPTPTPTITPSPTATNTPAPTNTQTAPKSEKQSQNQVILPPGVTAGDRWIDINLTKQRIYTYRGKNLINTFITSTGTWQYPTVTGQFKIYVKYRYADMAGPGYFLPNVPYVMYFYKGYGIHGTYWHNNFGTPMSHGCVNLRTQDAGWVYNWASIGTVVRIHY